MRKAIQILRDPGPGVLRGYCRLPEGKPSFPVAVLLHGLMDSGDTALMQGIAGDLADLGYGVIGMDLYGHGRSDGKLCDMTIPDHIRDAEQILAYTKGLPGAEEVTLLGHSQGGVAASIAAGEHPEKIRRLILLSPAANIETDARRGCVFGQPFDPAHIPESLPAFESVLNRPYYETAQKLDIYRRSSGFSGQVCLIYAGKDDVVPFSSIEGYARVYPKAVIQVVPEADHDFYEGLDSARTIIRNFCGE